MCYIEKLIKILFTLWLVKLDPSSLHLWDQQTAVREAVPVKMTMVKWNTKSHFTYLNTDTCTAAFINVSVTINT